MASMFCWPPRVKLPRNSRWELGTGGNVRCPSRWPVVKDESWWRSDKSCYDWHADLSGRCWVRLDRNGGFKGWWTTLNRWLFCVMSAPSCFVRWFTWRAFGGGKLSKLFLAYVYFHDIFSSIITPKGKSPNFWPTNFFNHNFGNQSLKGMYYCSNLVKPIHKPSRVYYANILNKLALKGIRTATLK